MSEPELALSIMQPWAWLIVNCHKNLENRTWPTRFRGPIMIHAGKKIDTIAADDVRNQTHPVTGSHHPFGFSGEFQTGGIVGEAEIYACIEASESSWFVGPHAFVLINARPLPFRPCRGQLGFFRPDFAHAEPTAQKSRAPDLFITDGAHA